MPNACNAPPTPTKASRALSMFLKGNRITMEDAAKALDCAWSTLDDVAKGQKRPRVALALRIQRWTGGKVRYEDFLTGPERSAVARQRPFKSSKQSKQAA